MPPRNRDAEAFFFVVAMCVFAYPAVAGEQTPPKEGPLGVETADGLSLNDVTRKKELPCKVYFPKTGWPRTR
jgi:hypothetical protein